MGSAKTGRRYFVGEGSLEVKKMNELGFKNAKVWFKGWIIAALTGGCMLIHTREKVKRQ